VSCLFLTRLVRLQQAVQQASYHTRSIARHQLNGASSLGVVALGQVETLKAALAQRDKALEAEKSISSRRDQLVIEMARSQLEAAKASLARLGFYGLCSSRVEGLRELGT
jgi:hypothetical protein